MALWQKSAGRSAVCNGTKPGCFAKHSFSRTSDDVGPDLLSRVAALRCEKHGIPFDCLRDSVPEIDCGVDNEIIIRRERAINCPSKEGLRLQECDTVPQTMIISGTLRIFLLWTWSREWTLMERKRTSRSV